MNNLVISGHLGQDPQLRETEGGDKVLNMRVAVPNRIKRRGEWVEEPLWITVTLFGKRAEGLSKFLKKGRLIEASGELRVREFEANDGTKRTAIELFANNCNPLGKSDGAPGDGGQERSAERGSSAPSRSRAPAAAGANDYESGGGYDSDPDDDIPF